MRILLGHFLIGLLLFASGCYTFRPADVETLPTGTFIRAQLSASGAEDALALAGSASRRLDGRLVRAEPDTLVLEVWRTDLAATQVFQPGMLRVPIPRRHVEEVAEKRISYLRTGLLATVVAVGAYQLYGWLMGNAGGSVDGPGGGPELWICCS